MVINKLFDLDSNDIVIISDSSSNLRMLTRTIVRDLNQQNLRPFVISENPYTFYPCSNYALLFNDRIDSIASYQIADYDVLLVCNLLEYPHYNIEEVISSLKAKSINKPIMLFISYENENRLIREDESLTNIEKYLNIVDKVFFFFNSSYKHFDSIYHFIDVKTKKLISEWERDYSRIFYLNDGFFTEYKPKDKKVAFKDRK